MVVDVATRILRHENVTATFGARWESWVFFSNDHENATLYRRCSHVREITLFNQLHTNVDITLRSNVVCTLSRPLKCNVIPRRCNNIETMLCLPYVIKYKQYLNVYIARALYISFLGYIYFFQLNNCS